LLDLVHPEDRVIVLHSFAWATAGPHPGERVVRLVHREGGWRPVALTPRTTEEAGVPRFSLALTGSAALPSGSSRAAIRLDDLVRRMARELEATGVVITTTQGQDAPHAPVLMDLSARQQEVVSRLLRGERVPRIAKTMYVSQSTVRNHLAAIFRKFGVHSQEELLTKLRRAPLGDTPPS
jgi:DNA-binding CsgD family transcriptional regulator